MGSQHCYIMGLIFGVVLLGAANRIAFKLMTNASRNYGYFDSQFTTIIFLPITFAVLLFKYFMGSITNEQWAFPQWKYVLMGVLDSLSGLLIVVGGLKVPGMMQNLLLQGVVPVTMVTSILCLRPRGCNRCSQMKGILQKAEASFDAICTLPVACDPGHCVAKIQVGDVGVFGPADATALETCISRPGIERERIIFYSSEKQWGEHARDFYSVAQCAGAGVIIGGLIVSAWPALSGSGAGAGPIVWDMVYFSSTIPIALSSVYKEIAFRTVKVRFICMHSL